MSIRVFFLTASVYLLCTPASLGAQETLSFPARASDIPADAIWTVTEFDEGANIIDFNVSRWRNGAWRENNGSGNGNSFDWGVPLYAPASGFIIACWRNFPDHPSPATQHPRRAEMFGGGNFVFILSDQGTGISINHLQSRSIPKGLCPVNDTGDPEFPTTTNKVGAWRVASYIEPSDWVRVREGEFIGRVGHNGSSSGPHLHISAQPLISYTGDNGRVELGPAQPMRFRNVWGHAFDHDSRPGHSDWYRWRGGRFLGNPACPDFVANNPICQFKAILASPFLRRGTALAGSVRSEMDVAFDSGNRMVSATLGQSDRRLKLIVWDLVGNAEITRRGQMVDAAAKEVVLVKIAPDTMLAALRLTDDRLRMVAFHIGALGTVNKLAQRTFGQISALDMALVPGTNRRAVVAIRTKDGRLKLIAFDTRTEVNGAEVETFIDRLGEIEGDAISHVAVTHMRGSNGVYAAQRDAGGRLRVTPYRLSADGLRFTQRNSATAGAIGAFFDVAPLASGVAVSVQDGQGKLRTMTWRKRRNDNLDPERRATVVDFPVLDISLVTTPHGSSNFAAIVRNGDGNLELVGFASNAQGDLLRRVGGSVIGRTSNVAVAAVSRSFPGLDPRDYIVTGSRDGSGELRLITWDANLVAP